MTSGDLFRGGLVSFLNDPLFARFEVSHWKDS